MASETVKNSTSSKPLKKKQERVGDREKDGGVLDEDYYLKNNPDRFGYDRGAEEALATQKLRGMIDEELAPTQPRLSAEEIARAVPDTNPITKRAPGYRDKPHYPSGKDTGSYRIPTELMTEEELIMQFLKGGRQI